jgi:hypothetical protein
VHVDAREDLGVGVGALGRQLHLAAAHVVPAALEDQHHVVGRAAAGAGQHGFHRPRRQVAAAAVGRAVHRQQVAAAGLGHKAHAGAGIQLMVHSIGPLPLPSWPAAARLCSAAICTWSGSP